MKRLSRLFFLICVIGLLIVGGVWTHSGWYGVHTLFRRGPSVWLPIATDSPRLSASMRLALSAAPQATPGDLEWHAIAPGFAVSDLPALVNGSAVDHILLARIDPAQFRFVVRNSSSGDRGLDQWMKHLGAALVVNGSYYAQDGTPDTPFLSDGTQLGPEDYDAKAGAFVASPHFTGVRDLATESWQAAFQGARDAMVSYPMLVADGKSRVPGSSRWLANRTFVGQDNAGQIIIGTTTDAFFPLDRLARFLLNAPLNLMLALNLDGGPVASQGISLNGYERRSYGRWEAQVDGDRVSLLTWPFGTIALPVVLAVLPK